ncbi:hypothetical protein RHSIM_Rhsim05G0227800 [Rhododendron simsii]|uniref:Protein LURP-one-related 15 n=1 Tax=Rhododendron simsii TaxID=118357 RepID=A0A834H9N7_RHOSS|nr:hypothetical protein RHSIM_Rhsim05G0227800 [Rhododendron simsii]
MFKIKGKVFSLRDRRVLLDSAGNPILTLQQKILTAHKRWQVYSGDSTDAKDLLFSDKKSSLIQFKTQLDVFLAANTNEDVCDFKIKGSWFERSCTIYLGVTSTVIAQISHQVQRLQLMSRANVAFREYSEQRRARCGDDLAETLAFDLEHDVAIDVGDAKVEDPFPHDC